MQDLMKIISFHHPRVEQLICKTLSAAGEMVRHEE